MYSKYTTHHDANAIGHRLKMEMKKRGMTSVDLASKADVKSSFLYDVMSGKSSNPSSIKLARVADALGISLAYLAGSSDSPQEGYQIALAAGQSPYVYLAQIPVATVAQSAAELLTKVRRNDTMPFHKEWLQQQFRTEASNLLLFTVQGDAMHPTLHDKDVVIVNKSQNHPSPAGLFLLFDGMCPAIRRLECPPYTQPLNVNIHADNQQYNHYQTTLDKLELIGRVVWFSRTL